MKHRARVFVIGAAPIAAAVSLFACSEDPIPSFAETPDGGSDTPAPSVEAGAEAGDAGIDARIPFDGSDEPVSCTSKPCVVQLVAGLDHFCALLEDKTVRCWGNKQSDAFGPLEGDDASSVPRPTSMGLSNVEQISAGGHITCARLSDGTVNCWGGNWGNELGLEPPGADYGPHAPAPVVLDGGALDGFARVDVGTFGTVFAVRASGELWSWGDNSKHVLGRPRVFDSYMDAWLGPGPVTYLAPGVSVVRAGGTSFRGPDGSAAFAITSDGRLLTWGTSNHMVAYPGPVPVVVDGLENVGSAAVTQANICAVADGQLYCWGKHGRLACTNSPYATTIPVAIRTHGTAAAQQVSLGISNTCVRLTDGTVECCGDDTRGQLGRVDGDGGAPLERSAPLLTPANAFTGHAVQIAVASRTICALVQGGTVQCWGNNENGQLGQGTIDIARHPTPVTVRFE
ncbi:MAG: hypothetical protein BGO98_37360 [Myxococcales bacterium 68-20]|nr:MAG: hypothetical protein BGO98_37360 [Myxococcales bacterium 68-20]